ncbi:hypothetical protein KIH74_03170 [Kineosporia sp. J2-2]|uniref:DUF1365 domain-containing protein n=1 Tax=Kineosporia corallincola TaxID=2835133 RepID=A0ABS5TA15_9ACTN|nr:DUF1365 family protein [Kineosporia corallincola]MBT0767907.1 hypothetical protein [Kineosporia corallincola]
MSPAPVRLPVAGGRPVVRARHLRGPNGVIDRHGGPAVYRCVVSAPGLRRRAHLWSVDLDDLPRIPGFLAGFRPSDHLGGPVPRAGLEHYLSGRGIDLDGGRVRMLSPVRVFGRGTGLPSVYWCHDRSGDLVCVVAELPEASGASAGSGEKYCHLAHVEDPGWDRDESACCTVTSWPDLRGPLDLTLTLHRAGQVPLATSMVGRGYPVNTRTIVRLFPGLVTTSCLAALRGRWHGLRARARELRLLPRVAQARR